MIKKYIDFIIEDSDDDDYLAKYYIFGSECRIAFSFHDLFIFDKQEINELILKYNDTYIINNEWGGGPVNKEFLNYFFDKYNNIFRHRKIPLYSGSYKPIIMLFMKTELGYYGLGFSLTKKLPCSIYMGVFNPDNNNIIEKSNVLFRKELEILSDKKHKIIYNYVDKEVYKSKLNLEEFVSLYDLELKNNINWIWKEK